MCIRDRAVIGAQHGRGGGAQQRPHGPLKRFAGDVPEGDVDSGERRPEHGAVTIARELVVIPVPVLLNARLLYTSPSPRDRTRSPLPSSALKHKKPSRH